MGLFSKVAIFLKHSILIICHGGHFSFSKLFLNVALYRLLAISAPSFFTPIDLRFFLFLLCFDFFKLYLEKAIKKTVVGNVPGNIFLKTFSRTSVVWPC